MPSLRIIETTASFWGVPDAVPGVLHSSCAECLSEQRPGSGHAGSDRQVRRCTWPGRDLGVRQPGIDETPINCAEVRHGVMKGVL